MGTSSSGTAPATPPLMCLLLARTTPQSAQADSIPQRQCALHGWALLPFMGASWLEAIQPGHCCLHGCFSPTAILRGSSPHPGSLQAWEGHGCDPQPRLAPLATPPPEHPPIRRERAIAATTLLAPAYRGRRCTQSGHRPPQIIPLSSSSVSLCLLFRPLSLSPRPPRPTRRPPPRPADCAPRSPPTSPRTSRAASRAACPRSPRSSRSPPASPAPSAASASPDADSCS